MDKNERGRSQNMTLDDKKIDVTLEITRRCPLRCIFCSSMGGEPHPNELGLKEWIRLVDESIELGAKSFLISGGEPFTSPFLRDLAHYINEKNVELSIYSSGNVGNEIVTPVDVSDLEYVAELGDVRMVMSLEGATPATHERITRVKNSFRNTIETIKNSLNLGLDAELHFVPTKINYKELPDVVKLGQQLKVNKVSVLRLVPQGRCVDYRDRLLLDREELIELKSIFTELEKYDDFVRIGSPFNPFLLSKRYKCTAGTNRMTITYNGLVAPCEAFKFILYDYSDDVNTRKYSLKYIWEQSQLFNEIRVFQKITNHKESECHHCPEKNLCGGGCPSQKILAGSIYSKDPICLNKLILSKIT